MIRITMTVDLPEWWGADEAFADGGKDAVLELINEDIAALFQDGKFSVEKV